MRCCNDRRHLHPGPRIRESCNLCNPVRPAALSCADILTYKTPSSPPCRSSASTSASASPASLHVGSLRILARRFGGSFSRITLESRAAIAKRLYSFLVLFLNRCTKAMVFFALERYRRSVGCLPFGPLLRCELLCCTLTAHLGLPMGWRARFSMPGRFPSCTTPSHPLIVVPRPAM